ncbi:MAG TPA: glycosyltransferase [Xanthobacteraceae bacterium]|jgi:glycosyltransferase involved in cell wall biosynthesis|nr:glycosyltransferase [Xanthobacteraceae bacterium]
MISVVIATKDSERELLPTLAALVPGAAAGAVREVIVTDDGSRDQTHEVAEIAGCHFISMPGSLGRRLAAGANKARAPWLMFLRPGLVPDPSWVTECLRFVGQSDALGHITRTATFRAVADFDTTSSAFMEALSLLGSALGLRAKPYRGLIISKRRYDQLGGHSGDRADCETELLRRLGRRQLITLRCGAMHAQVLREI